MTYAIREGRETDLPFIAANLRGADAKELVATYGHPRLLEGLKASFEASDEVCIAVTAEDRPLAIWGRLAHTRASMVIWCVATHEITKYRKAFVSESLGILRRWFLENPEVSFMFNFAHADNALHHKWLRFMGAQFFPPVPSGPLGEPFSPFVIRRENYV
jgi:hypothetical protein